MRPKAAFLAFSLSFVTWSSAGAQTPPGPARTPPPPPKPFHLTIDAATLAGLPRFTITATDENGHTNAYAGVSLLALIDRAGAPAGEPVRGLAMMSYIEVGAADGYHVIFTLPELDASFNRHLVLIADSRDGTPFDAKEGPYRLIVPWENRDARWVREVTAVDLKNAPPP
jgi:hypothetical protein